MLAPADITQIAPGLWRWTARHPGWVPGAAPESPADWPVEVGSVAYATPGALVLIDPLVPDGADALFAWLDERIAESGGQVRLLTTIPFHGRSRELLGQRYGAGEPADAPPEVQPIPLPRFGETVFWLPGQRALVPGDRILGAGRSGELRLCPESWLGYLPSGTTLEGLRAALGPLLDLPVEMVLVSHGDPVLSGGAAAIERALAA